MATSGSYNWTLDRDDIIQEALELIGVYDPGNTISNEDVSSCARSLNLMIKAWQAEHIALWANKEVALFLEEGEQEYDIGPTGDHCTASWIKTEVATAAASSASSVEVDSVTGITDHYDRDGIIEATTPTGSGSITLDGDLVSNSVAYMPSQRKVVIYSDGDDSGVNFVVTGEDWNGDSVTETITGPNTTSTYSTSTYWTVSSVTISGAGTGNIEVGCVGENIGIELDDGSMHWTYFAAALSTTMTLVTAVTDSVAVDNHVYIYTKEAQRPKEIIEAKLRDSDGNETPIEILSRQEYMELSDKDQEATPTSIYYQPTIPDGLLKIWPAPDDVQEYLKMTFRYPLEDLDASSDNFDFPNEWLEVLAWNLATRIAPKFNRVLRAEFLLRAEGMKETLKGFDREFESTTIEVVDR